MKLNKVSWKDARMMPRISRSLNSWMILSRPSSMHRRISNREPGFVDRFRDYFPIFPRGMCLTLAVALATSLSASLGCFPLVVSLVSTPSAPMVRLAEDIARKTGLSDVSDVPL